ncbi:glutamate receptor U1 [Drosophila pseudoobscura]|uniref:Glutamate receptor U1 n=1 Tax=Drosophila pseudoobscura pseudoobscura TaxID=46245 RepID=A0A6I8URI8_DROPS|nr:glutamate receptor U1 [Drosophila pseudoobscura]
MIKLQVKVISWVFIILTGFLCTPQIESINTNFLELAAFEDFLRSQHLQQSLVVRVKGRDGDGDGDEDGDWKIECHQKLLANYRVQYYQPGISHNFEDLMYYGAPRTAVLVLKFEHRLVKQWVYTVASKAGYFNNSLAWFMLGTSRASQLDEAQITENLGGYKMGIDVDITVALKARDNTSWRLYDVYRIDQQVSSAPLIVERKGEWSPARGYKLMDTFRRSWIIRRRNFRNVTLRGSTAVTEKPSGYDDMAYLANDKQLLQLDPMQRKTYQLFRLVERMYNLSLAISFTDNWGQQLANGRWSGVMGQITNGEADFAVCPIRFVPERQLHVQYSPVLHTQPIHFLFRHPRHSHIRNIFFEPLSSQVWWCVLVLITFSILLLVLLIRHEALQNGNLVETRVAFVWFTMLETYLQQGPATELFRLMSTRLLISASCIFSFMLMQFYGAFIVGSLLSDSPRSIVNLQALFESNLDIGMENISYNFAVFGNTSGQLVRDVYSKKICRSGEHNVITLEQGAERIIKGRFAFHAAIDRLYRLLLEMRMEEHEFCELQEIMFNPPYAAASVMAKGSPWREHLAHAILHLKATALMQYNDRLWSVPKPDCSLFKASQVEVDLEHFAPALFALVLAMIASALVFLLELMFSRLAPFRPS